MSHDRIGFIQGRLSPIVNGMIQCFPEDHWREEFPLAHSLGLGLIEWTLDFEKILDNPFLTADGQKEIKSLQSKYNLKIPSLTGDFFMQRPFFKASSEDEESQLIEVLRAVITACGKLGTEFLVIPLVDNGSLVNSEQEKYVVNKLCSLGSFLRESKVKIVFESDYGPKKLSDLIEKFPSDIFGINYDIGNSAALGFNPEEEWAAYHPRILNLHVKDRILGGTTVPLGEGDADLPKIFNFMKKYSYKGNIIMQTARASDGDHKQALAQYTDMIINWM